MVSTARKLKLDEMPQPDSEIVSKAMQRRVLICMCVMIFFNHLSLGNIIPSIALYARSFGVLQWAIGLAVGISGFSRLLAAFPAGAIAEKFGRKNGLAVGAITTAVGSLLCAFAPNYIVFLIGRFISGIGTGIVQISGQIVLLDITTPKNRGKTMAIYRSVSTFAMGIGPFPGGLLATHYGLQAPFISNIVTGCFTAILAWFLVPETQGFAEADAKKAKAAFKGTFFEKMKTLFKLPGFALISFIGFMISSTRQGGFTSIVPVIGHDRLL